MTAHHGRSPHLSRAAPIGTAARGMCALLALAAATILSTAALTSDAHGDDQTDRPPSADTLQWLRGDAQLTDVTFVTPEQGWAVGNRGVIWHTEDGGGHWQLQDSGVDCPLTCVQFLDARTGWAAGGVMQSQTHISQGVVLSTRDGGRHWSHDRKLPLPALSAIKFFDKNHGWALGRCSSLFPSGVFTSDDGGRSWTALPCGEHIAPGTSWATGDFIDQNSGAIAGPRGSLAVLRRRGIEASPSADESLRAWHRLRYVSEDVAWIVGDGGWVMHSRDQGRSWQTPQNEPPSNVRDCFDFYALAARGTEIWIAGTPGSKVFHSSDDGRSWIAQVTGQPLPLRSLAFVDEQRGWAVGDMGLILATRDGGRTWQRQRSGGSRAALLACFSTPAAVPLELIARLGNDEGYLGVVETLHREDIESPAAADLDARAHDAWVLAGGSGSGQAWRFPLRPAALGLSSQQMIEGWDRANDGKGLERLEAHIVQKIRQWRPAVVVTSADDQGRDATRQIVQQIVLRAVEHAADPTQFKPQITVAGLEPWKVQKVYATLPAGQIGSTTLTTSNVSARWGRTFAELAAPAHGLITGQRSPAAPTIGFRLAVDHVPQEQGKRDFFSGIGLSPGGEARRGLLEIPAHNLDELRRSAQSRRNLQAILARGDEKDAGADARWLGEIGELTRKYDAESGAEVLFQLGNRYHHNGRWELAAECFELLANRYPDHPLAGASLVWLVKYYASQEAQYRVRRGQGLDAQQVATQPAPSSGPRLSLAVVNGDPPRGTWPTRSSKGAECNKRWLPSQ